MIVQIDSAITCEIKRFVVGSLQMHSLSKKVIRPSKAEVERNPRSRSAKLRVTERRSVDAESHPPAKRSRSVERSGGQGASA